MGRGAVTVGRVIERAEDLEEGMAWLSVRCPKLAAAYMQTGPLPLRRKPEGFAELLSAIVSQQVSTASAAAIWARVEAAGMADPAAVVAATEDDLRALGLSRPKARYAKALAGAGIDYDALRYLPDDDVIATLMAVPGIGRWTAEIYAKFSLSRADVFAAGDLALQEAARLIYDLPDRPSERQLRALAAEWTPWRAVAARLLWAYYRVAKQREGIR